MEDAGFYAMTVKEATATSFPALINRAISVEAPSSLLMRSLLVAKELVVAREKSVFRFVRAVRAPRM